MVSCTSATISCPIILTCRLVAILMGQVNLFLNWSLWSNHLHLFIYVRASICNAHHGLVQTIFLPKNSYYWKCLSLFSTTMENITSLRSKERVYGQLSICNARCIAKCSTLRLLDFIYNTTLSWFLIHFLRNCQNWSYKSNEMKVILSPQNQKAHGTINTIRCFWRLIPHINGVQWPR